MNDSKPYPVPDSEQKRLEALRSFAVLDTSPEQAFDDFARLAAYICQTPIALITLVDEDRQWFKARVGLEIDETPREQAFCNFTILGDRIFSVDDAMNDERFASNPLVTGSPNIRFYAGAPLIDSDGFALGSICAIDPLPRRLSAAQSEALTILSRQVVAQFELRRVTAKLAEAVEVVKGIQGL